MKSFEDIRKKDLDHLIGEIATLARQLVEAGWSKEQVLAHVEQLLKDPTDFAH